MTDPTTDQTALREQVLDALDFSYCQTLGYGTPEALLAAYDADRTPADQTALRDRIAAALMDLGHPQWDAAEGADAVLAVLPATTDQTAEVDQLATDYAEERAERKVVQDKLARARDELKRLPVDRAAVLREAADRIDNEELPPDYVDMFDNGARWAAKLLRRVAYETAATETQADGAQRLCGKSRGVSGLYYRPCARVAGHEEAYCKSADGSHLFLAGEPAAGARQDGVQA